MKTTFDFNFDLYQAGLNSMDTPKRSCQFKNQTLNEIMI